MATVANDDPIGNGHHWDIPADVVLFPPEADDLAETDWAGDNDNQGLLAVELAHEVPAPMEPRLTLVEYVAGVAGFFRSHGTAGADLVAETVEELAAGVRRLQATTPDEYRSRKDCEEDFRELELEARGYDKAVSDELRPRVHALPPLPAACIAARNGYLPWTAEAAAANDRFTASIPAKVGGRKPLD